MSTQAKGSYTQLSGEHLCADDLPRDKDTKVEISGAAIEVVTSPNNQKKKMIVLELKGARKKMPINKTNGKMITAIAGSPQVENWIGCKISLYYTEIRAFGTTVGAIRVRPSK